MSRRSRIRAADRMWDATQYITDIGYQGDRSERQNEIIHIMDKLREQLTGEGIDDLGDLVRLAFEQGYEKRGVRG